MSRHLKIITIILAILAVIAVSAVAYFKFSTEDAWLCQNGEWVKHGNPRLAEPTIECITTDNNSTSNEKEQTVNTFTFDSGPKDLNTQRTYSFSLPEDITYETMGEDASSGYFNFKIAGQEVMRMISIDYALEKSYAFDSYKDAYAISFIGGHTNVLYIWNQGYQNDVQIFINTFVINGEPVFTTQTILNPEQLAEGYLNIKIDKLTDGDTIETPLTITGQARRWYFEGSFPIKLLDESGNELAAVPAQAQGEWMTTDWVPFIATLNFISPKDQNGTLIFEEDDPSGLKTPEKYERPIKLTKTETLTLKVFFGNELKNPNAADCSLVYPIDRTIAKTITTGQAALTELFKGPTESETKAKYYTSINSGVEIKKLIIKDGIAYADFNDLLDYNVGGSCRVTAIRSQITETLKQFSSVNSVVISIDGRTEDILQP